MRRFDKHSVVAIRLFSIAIILGATSVELPAQSPQFLEPLEGPVRLIYDTDIGNDVDDALALGVIHALQTRGDCELLGVTITKDHDDAARFVDAINRFYGRGEIPIGVCRSGITPEQSKFLPLVDVMDEGQPRYPHGIDDVTKLPDAVTLLRRLLSQSPDHSVVIAQVGFSSNLAKLLKSEADEYGPAGPELVSQKVRWLSLMAGAFEPINGGTHLEYNVVMDLPACQYLAAHWPTPMVYSGFEIGLSITYPSQSILQDYNYVDHHPLAEAYMLYSPPPHDRPNWDLTSVLFAVRPDRGYFSLSEAGVVSVDGQGATNHQTEPNGRHYYLIASDVQRARVSEALVALASQPPVHVEAWGAQEQ